MCYHLPTMKQKLWITLVTHLAYCIDKELYKAINYLKEQVYVLKEHQQKDKRILLNNTQRRRLAAKAKKLTRKLLEETTILFTPDTVLGWYRKLNYLILSSEQQLHYVLTEYLDYYHTGRIHQGIDRIIEPKYQNNTGDIFCIERLGGLLKSYHRKVA